jgi:beta-lactamase class A
MDRRFFLSATGLCLFVNRFALADDHVTITGIEDMVGGRVGLMALDTDSGETLEHRAEERFAMCSTFKWVLAAAVLERVDHGELRLEHSLHFDEDDLLDYAPVAREHVAKGSLTIDQLCAAAVSISDNTAANLLLEQIDGPSGLTAFLRRHGDPVTRLDRNEPSLNTNLPGDPRDTTTPRAMVGTMNTLLVGDILSSESRERLQQWLKDSATGLARLRAGLPRDWVAGDKTGTGVNGAANDVAIAWPPGRAPILIASYLSDSDASPDALNGAHVAIAAAVAKRFV